MLIVILDPLDGEVILADKDLSNGPGIGSLGGLLDIWILVFDVPNTQVAESGSEDFIHLREKLELCRSECVELVVIRVAACFFFVHKESQSWHPSIVAPFALTLVQSQIQLRKVVWLASGDFCEVRHLGANLAKELLVEIVVNRLRHVDSLGARRQ